LNSEASSVVQPEESLQHQPKILQYV